MALDFTIITPSYNYGRFLSECLESVAQQEGVTLEHLVMDGGSADHSASIVSGFPHATWIQKPDSGMSQAINRGFDRALGEWVMWLNADDRLKPGVLVRLKEFLARSHADVVYGDFDFIGEDGRFLRSIRTPRWSQFVNVHHHCCIGSTAAFYRKRTVLQAGHRLREDFRYVMDGEFYARLHAQGKRFQHLSLTVADFRLHGSNASLRHCGKTRDIEQIVRAEQQHVESRTIRRAYGVTLFTDPYLNGLIDGVLWIAAKGWKAVLKTVR
jgi:glycosyltransferase involved in cell wall biosynthesis